MKIEIKVPAMGESISEVTIGTFLKAAGERVSTDDELVELETDKVNQVLYAPCAGVLTWSVAKDDVAKIGQIIGSIDSANVATPASPPKVETTTPAAPEEKKIKNAPTPHSGGEARVKKEQFVSELLSPASEKAPPSPSIHAAETPAPVKSIGARTEVRQKMSKVRKLIATRLVDVMQHTAMLTTFNEVDMTAIMELRESYKESFVKQHNVRLGFMSFFIKAAVSAMKAFPEVNAYIDGDEIVHRHYFDVGVAVATDRGLIVPVVRGCDQLSFAGIEQAIEKYAKKAREGGLSADDLQGGGFTITNGGVYGSLLSTPILNPPQCAILGMHKIMKRPVVVNDAIVIRQMMYLALSYDHRILDGKEAVSFLVHIKNCLEAPSRLLLEI